MMGSRIYIGILAILNLAWAISAQNVFIVAPNTLRLGANETVGVVVAKGSERVSLYLQDFPGRKSKFSETNITVSADAPQDIQMTVNPTDIPDFDLTSAASKQYVLLIAESQKFRKEVKVLVTMQSGYMFIQTDKTIYTPNQQVLIRIINLNEDMLTSNETFTVQIRNPQNVIVENTLSTSPALTTKHGLYIYKFAFPSTAMEGEWSVVVKYGHKAPRNETVTFELKEFSLPTYEVKLSAPEVILPSLALIEVKVEARYVYGQYVEGSVRCKFGVMSETKKIVYVGQSDILMLNKGNTTCKITPNYFEEHKQVGWFPKIAGNYFVVEALVTEKATGEQEKASSQSTLFSNTRYLVDFKRCLSDFKPGYTALVLADIKEANGKKAKNVETQIEVTDEKGKHIRPENERWQKMSDDEGRVAFAVPTHKGYSMLKVKVHVYDDELVPRTQGQGNHVMRAFTPDIYIALDRTTIANTLVVGNEFFSNVYSNPKDLFIAYVVTSNGKIAALGSLSAADANQRILRFKITDTMIPSLRITLFAVHQAKTLTDSVKIDVQNECRAAAKIKLDSTFRHSEPGKEGSITVQGTKDTVVGLLAVDKAVYVLRNKGLLTKEKMFAKMEEHDLGCGPGGGSDAQQVLANAGLVILSDSSTNAPERPSCAERKIIKREIREDVLRQEEDKDSRCCKLGMYRDRFNRECEERAEIVMKYHEDDICAEAFLRCCLSTLHLHTAPVPNKMVVQSPQMSIGLAAWRNFADEEELHFVTEAREEEIEDETPERKDFRQTWIFETGIIGSDNQWQISLNVPHSITTWMIQAVALNSRQGMCVANPIEAVIFKSVFIQMKLPYSVVRGEQIELRATIFNYGSKRISVLVSMYGVEGLCSEAQPNEKGEKKKIYVSGKGGAETVAFPVVPLEVGVFTIKVVAIAEKESDKVVQKLNVVAEGTPHVENIVIDIDPANLDRRKKRSIVSDKYETHIDEEKKQQFTSVTLEPEHDYIAGTESCHITAIGDKFGPTIHTALNNPDQLIRMPQGCGEQTMAYLGPTLYTLHYLKVTGKMTAQQEENGYKFIREGYKKELNFRKGDGSYAAFQNRASSTWLTAFVAKVFCQASKYVFVDENTVCSALDWLVKQQTQDGSFIERTPVIHHQMTGGIKGAIPMTAFVLNAFHKCDCNDVNLTPAKEEAIDYLMDALPHITDPYQLAIATYALSLADPGEIGLDANRRLLAMSTVDEDLNLRYWGQPGTPLSVEATSFALLAQLIHNNKDAASSIVNWLNTQRTTSGSFWSTQDTVIALEALAEYAIYARDPEMNLCFNLTSSSDVNFKETVDFKTENARVLRSYELKKLGGRLHLEALGTGVSKLGIELRYNLPTKIDEICKFEISENVTEAKEELILKARPPISTNIFDDFAPDMMNELAIVNEPLPQPNNVSVPMLKAPRPSKGRSGLPEQQVLNMLDISQDIKDLIRRPVHKKVKRAINRDQKLPNSQYVANISLCIKYLSDDDSDMALVDVGIFTGYRVDQKDLKRIKDDPNLPVAHYEEAGRSIIFYLDKIPHEEPTCFWFRVAREFIVSHLESSLITVKDYYNPQHFCRKFYSPNQHSAIVQTVCVGKVCQCAEGGCPPKQPFDEIKKEPDTAKQRGELLQMACDNERYVWKAKVERVNSDGSSYQTVDIRVLSVFKEGRESREDILTKPKKQLLGRKTCESAQLKEGQIYIIMGVDKEPIQEDSGIMKYTYYLDKQTLIHEWFNVYDKMIKKSREDKNLQKVFGYLENQFLRSDGCLN